jgi:hypothetical protein
MYITIPDGAASKYSIDLIHFHEGGFYVELNLLGGVGGATQGAAFFVEDIKAMSEKFTAIIMANRMEKP